MRPSKYATDEDGLTFKQRTSLMLELFDLIREPSRRYTIQEIGDAVGMSRETVRKIEVRALEKMRRELAKNQRVVVWGEKDVAGTLQMVKMVDN